MSLIDEPFTPWSELEGREIQRRIKELRKKGEDKRANQLQAIDTRVRIATGDKPAE